MNDRQNGSAAREQVVRELRAAGCVFAEEEAQLFLEAAGSAAELDDMVKRRAAGFPLEHIVGWVDFCGQRIALDPGVFVPRQRSEFLARQAVALVRPGDVVVDLCCGSGALGAVVASVVPDIDLHAADLDPAAVQCARRNIHSGVGSVYEGDLFEPLPARLHHRVNVIIANAPYVPTGSIAFMPAEAREHEARMALDGGADGLDIQRRIAAEASRWLVPGGVLLVEASERQASLAVALFAQQGLVPEWVRSEEWDANVIVGTRPNHTS